MNLLSGVHEKASEHVLQHDATGPEVCGLVHSYYRREVGPLARAQLCFGQYSQLPRPTSPAARRGVRYEKKVLSSLERRLGNRLVPGPLFTFEERSSAEPPGFRPRLGRVYPDAILFSSDYRSLAVIEIKYRHTADAWWQLNRCYLPIARKALPFLRVVGVEITSSYDPTQRLPQKVAFLDNVEDAFETREVFHPLHVLTERELRNDRGVA